MLELSDDLPADVGISQRLNPSPTCNGQRARPGVHESHSYVAHNPFPVTQSERGAPFDPDTFYERTRSSSPWHEDAAHSHAEKWLRFLLFGDIVNDNSADVLARLLS